MLSVLAAAISSITLAFAEQLDAAEGSKASFMEIALYVIIPILLVILIIFGGRIYKAVAQRFSSAIKALKGLFAVIGIGEDTDLSSVNESLEVLGYAYDPHQDIFYSTLDPWQKNYGYCRLYDEAAAPLGMIIDCEPIYFDYNGRKWLIEFWKGQYDLTTGCEIGVYSTDKPKLIIPGVFNGTFYDSVDSEDFLKISYSLLKNRKSLFVRKGTHWWLTGFKLGLFSEPSELSMYIMITLKDRTMRNAFLQGLKNAGYSDRERLVDENTVKLIFNKPHTPQPISRTNATDAPIQKKNKLLCDKYREITKGYVTMEDKLKAVHEKAPDLYGHIIGLGKPKELFNIYETIKKYLND